jgi:hypothetical protein
MIELAGGRVVVKPLRGGMKMKTLIAMLFAGTRSVSGKATRANSWGTLLAIVAVTAGSTSALAVDWNATVGQLQGLSSGANCTFFTLNGVSQADPVVPSNPWFAIDRSQIGATDAYALLLAAKVSGSAVRVTTTGGTVCGGYPGVNQVIMP